MALRIQPGASRLSRSNSKSVAGYYHWLGNSNFFFLNAPIYAHYITIPVVTAAVSESECAGVFANGQVLSSLGCGSGCACGLASETARAKKIEKY